MIPVPTGVRVWLATGVMDMRGGMNTMTLQVQEDLGRDPQPGNTVAPLPYGGHLKTFENG